MRYEQIYFLKDSGYFGFYEVSILGILIILLFFFIKFTKSTIILNKKKEEPKATNYLMVSIFIFFIACLIGLVNILAYQTYLSNIKIIDEKKYKIVEGKINHYKPINITDKKFESFDVNGIHFIYSPAIRSYSFSQVKGEGNPLEKESMVRIWYYNKGNKVDGNLILKLEWKPKRGIEGR